eukprot:3084578-Prymnesium_polylepis.1
MSGAGAAARPKARRRAPRTPCCHARMLRRTCAPQFRRKALECHPVRGPKGAGPCRLMGVSSAARGAA